MKSYYEAVDIITEASLYLHQVHATRKFSFGTWTSRQHVFVSIKAGEETGYGENIVSVNQPEVSLEDWKAWLQDLERPYDRNDGNGIGGFVGKAGKTECTGIVRTAGKETSVRCLCNFKR